MRVREDFELKPSQIGVLEALFRAEDIRQIAATSIGIDHLAKPHFAAELISIATSNRDAIAISVFWAWKEDRVASLYPLIVGAIVPASAMAITVLTIAAIANSSRSAIKRAH